MNKNLKLILVVLLFGLLSGNKVNAQTTLVFANENGTRNLKRIDSHEAFIGITLMDGTRPIPNRRVLITEDSGNLLDFYFHELENSNIREPLSICPVVNVKCVTTDSRGEIKLIFVNRDKFDWNDLGRHTITFTYAGDYRGTVSRGFNVYVCPDDYDCENLTDVNGEINIYSVSEQQKTKERILNDVERNRNKGDQNRVKEGIDAAEKAGRADTPDEGHEIEREYNKGGQETKK